MAFGDPNTPFFSFVEQLAGTRVVCHLGRPGTDGRTPFEAFPKNVLDLDEPITGFWSPAGGFLTIVGEIAAEVSDIDLCGRYLVIEKDGSGTVETDGSRSLDEGEVLITANFLDDVLAGSRHAMIRLSQDDDDGAGPDDDLDAVGVNSAGLRAR